MTVSSILCLKIINYFVVYVYSNIVINDNNFELLFLSFATHKTHNYGSLHIFLFSKGTYGTRRDMSPTPKLASGDYIEYVLGHF